jgi:hypothetical protein
MLENTLAGMHVFIDLKELIEAILFFSQPSAIQSNG